MDQKILCLPYRGLICVKDCLEGCRRGLEASNYVETLSRVQISDLRINLLANLRQIVSVSLKVKLSHSELVAELWNVD